MLRYILLFGLFIWGLIKVTNYLFGTAPSSVSGGRARRRAGHDDPKVDTQRHKTSAGKGTNKYDGAEYVDYKEVE